MELMLKTAVVTQSDAHAKGSPLGENISSSSLTVLDVTYSPVVGSPAPSGSTARTDVLREPLNSTTRTVDNVDHEEETYNNSSMDQRSPETAAILKAIGQSQGRLPTKPSAIGLALVAIRNKQTRFKRQEMMPWLGKEASIAFLKEVLQSYAAIPMLADVAGFLDPFNDPLRVDKAIASTAGWAYMHCISALGVRVKTANSSFVDLSGVAWPFFKNSFLALTELMATGDGPLSAQVVVAMAIFILETPDSRTTSMLASAAARLSQHLGFHRTLHSDNVEEAQVQGRVFWAAYILDKSSSLLYDVASTQDDDDIEIELPTRVDDDAGWFKLRAKLAMVESSVRKWLYTARGLRLGDEEIIKVIIDLDGVLEDCIADLAPGIQNIYDGVPDSVGLDPEAVNFLLALYNCSIMIHWAARRHSQWGSVGGSVAIRPGILEMPRLQLFICKVRCRTASQAALDMFCKMPTPQYAEIWLVASSAASISPL